MEPFAMQGLIVWTFCTLVCISVSLCTAPPPPEKVAGDLTFDPRRMNIKEGLGGVWYRNAVFWWAVFVGTVVVLVFLFSGRFY